LGCGSPTDALTSGSEAAAHELSEAVAAVDANGVV
jgi:hypothetical protein